VNVTAAPTAILQRQLEPPSTEALQSAAHPALHHSKPGGQAGQQYRCLATLERLGELMQKGILTEDEFSQKAGVRSAP